MRSILLLTTIFLCTGALALTGQERFTGGILAGAGISQLNGDEAYGYHHKGFLAGAKVGYALTPRWQMELELLYNQKGSQRSPRFKEQSPFWEISLDYFEIPVLIGYRDWLDPKGFYHMVFYTGPSYAYLFNSKVTNEKYKPLLENNLQKHDITWHVGVTYQATRHLGATIRYNRSLTKVWEKTVVNDEYSNYMLGYQIALAVQYLF